MPRRVLSSPLERAGQRDQIMRAIEMKREDTQAHERDLQNQKLNAAIAAKQAEFGYQKQLNEQQAGFAQGLAQTKGKIDLQNTELVNQGAMARQGLVNRGSMDRTMADNQNRLAIQTSANENATNIAQMRSADDRLQTAATLFAGGGITGDQATNIASNSVSPFGGIPAKPAGDKTPYQFIAPKYEDTMGGRKIVQPGGVFNQATGKFQRNLGEDVARFSASFAALNDPKTRAAKLDQLWKDDPELAQALMNSLE